MGYYSIEYSNIWIGIKETAFRTNAQGLNTANVYNSSFRRFPIKWEGAIEPQPLRYNLTKTRSAGKGLDYSNIYRDGYADCRFAINGDILDFMFLYQLCGACTTAGGPTYTHTYASSTTPSTPTFQMLQRIKNVSTWTAAKKGYTNEAIADGNGHATATMTSNTTIALNAFAGYILTIDGAEYRIVSNTATAGASAVVFTVDRAITCTDASSIAYMSESKYILYVGCKIVDFVCYYSENTGRLRGTLIIEVAYTMGGTPLTTEPTWITDPPYYFNPSTGLDFKVAATTQVGYCSEFTFHYSNGQSLRKPNYLVTPDLVLSHFRTIEWDFTFITETLDDFIASQGDPTTDQDVDIAWTLSGGDGNDSLVATFVKTVLELLSENYDYKGFYLARKYKISLNPSQTSTLTLVETNSAASTYYEG